MGQRQEGLWVETGSVPRYNGSLCKTCWKEATHSEAQGHRPVQKLLFVTSGPALRGSRSDLSNRGAWAALQRGLCGKFLGAEPCGITAQVNPISWEAPASKNPVPLGGASEQVFSLCSHHRVA